MDTIAVLEALLINLEEKNKNAQVAYDNKTTEELDYAMTHLGLAVEEVLEYSKAYIKEFNKKDNYVIENIKQQLKIEEVQDIINKQADIIKVLQCRK
jgi:hypothetical protein